MMNLQHVEVVKKGAAAIEEWRRKHPEQTLDLSGVRLHKADLRKANLYKANLERAHLYKADLRRVNLSEATLFEATLFGADLFRANLSGADVSWANLALANLARADFRRADLSNTHLLQANLAEANLSGADLRKADFSIANLSKADFSGANLRAACLHYSDFLETNFSDADLSFTEIVGLSNVNLTGAIMDGTILAMSNLTQCVGLKTVKHNGPSYIDFNTLKMSFFEAGSCLTSDMETFLLNSGIPKEFLETLPGILAKVQYFTSFICYGQPDLDFAERLVKDLKSMGVSCWLYSMDATPGEKVWGEIIQKRREAEKMIVLCSANALVRDGVLKEIEEQIDEDPDKMVPISLDDTWKQNGFLVKRGQRDLKPFLLERTYADFSNPSKYNESLLRLLKGIKKSKDEKAKGDERRKGEGKS